MKSLKKLLERMFSKDRRRADRQLSPELGAHYWNGGSPTEHSIRDVSSTGLFLVTEERWYPGTLLMMTLLMRNEGSERSIAVQSKAVRWGEDGVGLEFVALDEGDPRRGQSVLAGGADRKTLEKFLEEFRAGSGFVIIKYLVHPSDPSVHGDTAWS